MALTLQSSAFQNGKEIPSLYTCDGSDLSPPLAWSNVPPGAKSLALIVDDPDAPDPRAPKMTWVHWVLYGLSPATGALAEGAGSRPVPGAREGMNDFHRTGYGGPCPPVGRHRYVFKLHALDVGLPDLSTPTKAKLEKAMEGHVLAKAELVGTYQRGGR